MNAKGGPVAEEGVVLCSDLSGENILFEQARLMSQRVQSAFLSRLRQF